MGLSENILGMRICVDLDTNMFEPPRFSNLPNSSNYLASVIPFSVTSIRQERSDLRSMF